MRFESIDCLSVHVFIDRKLMLLCRMTIANELDNILTEQYVLEIFVTKTMGFESIDCLYVHVFMDRRLMLSYRMTIGNELDNILTEQ